MAEPRNPSQSAHTELILTRHGEVVGPQLRLRILREQDPPLSAKGRESAALLAARLACEHTITAIYTSPLRRAQETAAIIASSLDLAPQVVEAFREWNFQHQADKRDRMRLSMAVASHNVWPFQRLLDREWTNNPALRSFVRVVGEILNRLVDKHSAERIIIVSHWGTIDAIMNHFIGNDEQWPIGSVRHCSLTRLAIASTVTKIITFNDCSHLQPH